MYSMFFVSRRQALGYLLACSAVCVGCGSAEESSDVPVHPAEGIVRFKGQPIAGALVALHPRNGAKSVAPNPRATVQPDGKFQLTTYRQHDGAPEGEYVVTVQWHRTVKRDGDVVPGPNVLPAKYAKPESSDITVRIASGTNQLSEIELR